MAVTQDDFATIRCPVCGVVMVIMGRYVCCPASLEHTPMKPIPPRFRQIRDMLLLPCAVREGRGVYRVNGKLYVRENPGWRKEHGVITARYEVRPDEWERIKLEPLSGGKDGE